MMIDKLMKRESDNRKELIKLARPDNREFLKEVIKYDY